MIQRLRKLRPLRRLQGTSPGQPTTPTRVSTEEQAAYVCHCRHVEYTTVDRAIRSGARTIADLQRRTTACTRCFGCRFELEGMLRSALGTDYRHETTISLPEELRKKTKLPQPMYMPVLAGFAGAEIDTRVIVFNLEGPPAPVGFRADLLALDGSRVRVWKHSVVDGSSAVLDLSRREIGDVLPGGVGVVKLLLDADSVGSLRPYFHWVTPTSLTSTHEKKGPKNPERNSDRSYHWIFPIGPSARREDAYFFCTNTQTAPMAGQRLVWQSNSGHTSSSELPTLEFNQTAVVPLHEAFPDLTTTQEGGAVRLEPATHAISGFMIRVDPERQLWRVQHL